MRITISVRLLCLTLSALFACSPPPDGDAPGSQRFGGLFTGRVEIVDLTHALSSDMPFWPNPTGNPFRHDTLRAHADGAPAMAAYATPEHHGTHIDAPVHSAPGQPSVDQLSPSQLFGPAAVIDVGARVADDPDYALTVSDLERWEAEHGRIPEGAVVLLRTGWGRRWHDPERYVNLDAEGGLHFPGFSEEVASYLVRERSVKGIGVDSPSVDPGNAEGFPVHAVANGAGKYHLENVANLEALPATGAGLIVAPIKIRGGSGGQVRLFAVLP